MNPLAAITFFVFVAFLIISSAIYHAYAADCTYETRVRHGEGGGTVVLTVRICCDEQGRCKETVIRRH
jgi:hypothetical protein